MTLRRHRRWMAPVAVAAAVGFALTGCTGDIANEDAADTDCADYEEYGTFDGAEVTVAGTILDLEADRLSESWADFETCTGISVDYQGSSEFEAQIAVLAEGGNAPDVGIVPQPGLLNRLADGGWLIPASQPVVDNIDEWWDPIWKEYATVDGDGLRRSAHGQHQGLRLVLAGRVRGERLRDPGDARRAHRALRARSRPTADTSRGASASSRVTPPDGRAPTGSRTTCCACTAPRSTTSGSRTASRSTTRRSPRHSTRSAQYLKSDDMVNGGIGDVSTQVTEAFQTAGLPILDGECSLHHQASFYETFWNPEGGDANTVASDGTVFAFLLPPEERRRPAAGHRWRRVPGRVPRRRRGRGVPRLPLERHSGRTTGSSLGGVISANKGLDPEVASSELLVQSIEILQNPETTFRFDGSDLMPGAVGADSFWKGIVAWVGGESTAQVLDTIEASWPAS